MTLQQVLLFAILGTVLGLLIWGRLRHDLVAAAGLFAAVALGLVPQGEAFSGFANPAVVVVALVLVASRAFENSGALGVLTKLVAREERPVSLHILTAGSIGAALSAVINNVAALALLMPIDVQAARRAGRPPGITLMPLAFCTILGGMTTLIGTPPNIIVAAIRAERLGEPYGMFDFTAVGLAIAVIGTLFVAFVGWRFVPRRKDEAAALPKSSFRAELRVPEESPAIGRSGLSLDEEAEKADVVFAGLIRGSQSMYAKARLMNIAVGDVLIVEGSTDAIAGFIKGVGLQTEEEEKKADGAPADEKTVARKVAEGEAEDEGAKKSERKAELPEIYEAVVRADSRIAGRSAFSFDLRRRFGVTLLGIARAGVIERQRVHRRIIQPGDVLLLTGRGARRPTTLESLGLISVNQASVAPFKPLNVALTIGLFVAAILCASLGFLSFTVAIAIAVAAYAALGLVPAKEFYEQIEWPVVVMLACLLPIGAAFERVGGTELIAGWIFDLTRGAPAVVALAAIMIVTMSLSDALNNVATIVIMAPVAIDLAGRLQVSPDTFLMGVAISASCAFLTPIGHKNNTLIMGPGGFKFSDYWRMGLPLELVVLAVAVPMLLIVWPLKG